MVQRRAAASFESCLSVSTILIRGIIWHTLFPRLDKAYLRTEAIRPKSIRLDRTRDCTGFNPSNSIPDIPTMSKQSYQSWVMSGNDKIWWDHSVHMTNQWAINVKNVIQRLEIRCLKLCVLVAQRPLLSQLVHQRYEGAHSPGELANNYYRTT